jgi:putative transcriptional regulator
MSDSIFDELYASMKQSELIVKGQMTAARVTRYDIADVKLIRSQLDVSQKELANAMDVSIDTVKSWEQGRRNPTGLASKVLNLLAKEPDLYTKFSMLS